MSDLKLDTFQILLNGFHGAITCSPTPEKVKTELEELMEAATLDNELTFWQKDAIIARCKNYLSGNYGSTSKELNSGYYSKK
jgi:hypothetical protein